MMSSGGASRLGMTALLCGGLLLGGGLESACADVGKVLYVRGNASARAPGQGLRIVAAGAPLAAGDVVSTGQESFSVLELEDRTRILLRPESSFAVTALDLEEGRENMTLDLIRGGIRALTGFLGKRRPDSVRVNTGVATIGIRGTHFALRRCGAECAEDAKSFMHVATPVVDIVGRALAVVGDVTVKNPQQLARHVLKGTPVYVGETLSAGAASYAVIAFQDQSRVTLQPQSEFHIDAFTQAPATPANENALFRLLRGGLRVATGLLAKRRPEAFKVGTGVATIGIRGTGFDLVEAQTCGGKQAKADAPGLTASVWKGAIALEESNAEVKAGESVCLLEKGGAVTRNQQKPALDTPRPDEVEVPGNTFEATDRNGTEPGLQLSVLDGHVVLFNDQGEVHLGPGEDAFAESLTSSPLRVRNSQSVVRADPFLTLDLGGDPASWDAFDPAGSLECPIGG